MKQFADSLRAMDGQLRTTRPPDVSPENLHEQIMRSVRATEISQSERSRQFNWRWLPVPIMALLVLAGVILFSQRPRFVPVVEMANTTLFIEATVTLEKTQQLAQTAPAAVVAPLSQEMEFLRADIQKTTEFLLASIP